MTYPPQPPQQPQQPPTPPQYPQQQQYGQYAQTPAQPQNAPMALWGMIMAIAAVVIAFIPVLNLLSLPLNLAAFIVSIIGLNQVKKSNGALGGRGMAIAGIVISSVWFGLFLLLIIFAGAIFASLMGGMM